MRREYDRVLKLGLLDIAISRFREGLQVDNGVCDARVIDLLIWGYVALLRSGAQWKAECLYK